MFKWLNKQGVASSDGFTLQSRDRYWYHYIEMDRVMRVTVEPSRDSKGRYFEEISENSLRKWLPPFEDCPISEAQFKNIKSNISNALDFMKIPHVFR